MMPSTRSDGRAAPERSWRLGCSWGQSGAISTPWIGLTSRVRLTRGSTSSSTALPDTVNADGVSTSQVRVVLRNQNGAPVTGFAVLFDCDGADRFCGGGAAPAG